MRIHTYTHMHACMHTKHIHTCAHACTHAHTSRHTLVHDIVTHMHMHMYTHMHTHTVHTHATRLYTVFVSLMRHKYKDKYAAAAEVLGMAMLYMLENRLIREASFLYCLLCLLPSFLSPLPESDKSFKYR